MAYKVTMKPRSQREALIAKRLENSDKFGETIYDFRSDTFAPREISLPIGVPVYRLENCRTFSAQQTEIARKCLPKEFFEKGQEATDAQQAQHVILVKLAKQGTESVTPIFSVLQEEGQRESILITHTGLLVNGNRRLAAMRELSKLGNDGSIDDRFTNVRCAVLPADITRDEIDDIEAALQARPQTKLEYDWIGDARLVRRQVEKGRSTKEVADRLRRNKNEIENVLQSLDEAELYLSEWVMKPGEYDLLQDGQQIFGDIPKALTGKDENLQNASRAIAWSIYKNREGIEGRIYRYNTAFGKLAPAVMDILQKEINTSDSEDTISSDDDDFDINLESGEAVEDYTSIINALRDSDSGSDTMAVLIEACESAIEMDKGVKNENAALKALVQVNSRIAGIDMNSAGRTTLPSVVKQIKAIREGLDKIEEVAYSRMPNGTQNKGLTK